MNVYKMIYVNRFREYLRLIKKMYIELIAIVIVAVFLIYSIWVWYVPLLSSMTNVNYKVLFAFFCCLFIFNFKRCFKSKPIVIVKPITLFLLPNKKLKKIFIIKYFYYFFKYGVLSFILTICSCGMMFDKSFFIIFIMFLSYFEIGFLLSWNIYNEKNKSKIIIYRLLFFASSIISILGYDYQYIIFLNIVFAITLFLYTIFDLKLKYSEYYNDMEHFEKVLVAQNNNNMVLLSQYSKEKIASKATKKNYNNYLYKKFPLIWKVFLSITRIGKILILVGMVIFACTFLIYTVPFFHQIPYLEMEQIRYTLLLFGVFFFYQTTIQTFVRQLDDLMEKRKEGLYIPIKVNNIILQFAVCPLLILTLMTIIISVLLKSQIILSIIFYFIMVVYLMVTLVMSTKNKQLLNKILIVLNLLILLISNLLILS